MRTRTKLRCARTKLRCTRAQSCVACGFAAKPAVRRFPAVCSDIRALAVYFASFSTQNRHFRHPPDTLSIWIAIFWVLALKGPGFTPKHSKTQEQSPLLRANSPARCAHKVALRHGVALRAHNFSLRARLTLRCALAQNYFAHAHKVALCAHEVALHARTKLRCMRFRRQTRCSQISRRVQ